MKKWIALLCAALLLGLAGTGALAHEAISVGATSYPLYDLARVIGGALVEPVALYAQADAQADCTLILCIGGEDEPQGEASARVVRVADWVADADAGVMAVPVTVMIAAGEIADALGALMPAHAQDFRAQAQVYVEEMIALDQAFRQAVKQGMSIACADEGSLEAFAAEYGVPYAPGDENALALYTYNAPEEEDADVPYAQLMQRNIEVLQGAE